MNFPYVGQVGYETPEPSMKIIFRHFELRTPREGLRICERHRRLFVEEAVEAGFLLCCNLARLKNKLFQRRKTMKR